MEKLPDGTVIIQGDAAGADTIAKACATERGFEVLSFPADWTKFGNSAGHKRNRQMINEGEPNLVVAFIDTNWKSAGTHNMIELSEACALQVIRIEMACETLCVTCAEPYSNPCTPLAMLCSNGFHCCRECVWDNGKRTTLCDVCNDQPADLL